jgi:large conductance mechanosensitive channel
MGILKEFKEFASKGSVVDLAVGVVIGAAFGKIVTSLVEDIIMPPIGLLLSGIDFSKLAITLKNATGDEPPVLLKYGSFINAIIAFIIVAFCIFVMLKGLNRMRKQHEEAPAGPTPDQQLLTEIRDELRRR